MKSGLLAVVVAAVFVLGIVAGAAFFTQQAETSTASTGAGKSKAEDGPRREVSPTPLDSSPTSATGESTAAPTDPEQPNPSTPPQPGLTPDRAPGPRPTLPGGGPSPDALAQAEELAAERERLGDEGHGKTRAMVYEFESEEARIEHEAERRANWQDRLNRENDIKLSSMRESVGLTGAQESRLREILDAELAERMKLVDGLAAKEITRTSFDQGIRDNMAAARQALQALLTPEQYEVYAKLKPRDQVLRDETK